MLHACTDADAKVRAEVRLLLSWPRPGLRASPKWVLPSTGSGGEFVTPSFLQVPRNDGEATAQGKAIAQAGPWQRQGMLAACGCKVYLGFGLLPFESSLSPIHNKQPPLEGPEQKT